MLAVRIHLDDCFEGNGPLRVIPNTHRAGRVTDADVALAVPAGGAVLMRPLLLHASSAARTPAHRRVIHIDYAAPALPNGLRWLAESQTEPRT